MSMVFVDTNIFIEVFARRGDKSEKCRKLLEGEQGISTSSLVVCEVEWVLRDGYNLDREIISKCLRKMLVSKINIEDRKLLVEVLNYYESSNVDWTDCFNMWWMKDRKLTEIYSYDRGLKRFNWIKRLEP